MQTKTTTRVDTALPVQQSGLHIIAALTTGKRLRGLLGREREWLAADEALLLAPCSSIHTFGMKNPIDVVFLDRKGVVLKTVEALQPCKIASCRGACMVLESPSPSRLAQIGGAGKHLELEFRP